MVHFVIHPFPALSGKAFYQPSISYTANLYHNTNFSSNFSVLLQHILMTYSNNVNWFFQVVSVTYMHMCLWVELFKCHSCAHAWFVHLLVSHYLHLFTWLQVMSLSYNDQLRRETACLEGSSGSGNKVSVRPCSDSSNMKWIHDKVTIFCWV